MVLMVRLQILNYYNFSHNMNGKMSKLLRKLSKERLLNYNKLKDKFKGLNRLEKTQVIKDIKNIFKNE